MPAGVKYAVRAAAQKYGRKTEDEARDFVTKMEREGRLIEECWN
jgi:sulfite reductase alpha subunit-like flavoprotein